MTWSGRDLTVMTFNLRCDDAAGPEGSADPDDPDGTDGTSWRHRRLLVGEMLREELPAVLGTQEGLPGQRADLAAELPAHYAGFGQGRDGGAHGEAMRVYVDTRRLEPLAGGDYWLSDTPEVAGSKTWGGGYPRMVTWLRLRLRATVGGEVLVANTHLEAFDAGARALSADLIRARLARDVDPVVPVVLTGDFNEPAGRGGAVYDTLVTHGPLVDTWTAAPTTGPSFGTFHDYGPLEPDGPRIDWILTSPDVETLGARVNTFERQGRRPSDHLPVQAELRLPHP